MTTESTIIIDNEKVVLDFTGVTYCSFKKILALMFVLQFSLHHITNMSAIQNRFK
jgi:hypothetical protein